MKKTNKQKARIIENIFDIIMQTKFEKIARKEMLKDLNNKNVTIDKKAGLLTIETWNGEQIQYKITIN